MNLCPVSFSHVQHIVVKDVMPSQRAKNLMPNYSGFVGMYCRSSLVFYILYGLINGDVCRVLAEVF